MEVSLEHVESLYELGGDVMSAGGSSAQFVKDALSQYLSDREASDAGLAAAVREWCDVEASSKYDAVARRTDEDVVGDVVSSIEAVLKSPPTKGGKGKKKEAEALTPANLDHHKFFRFAVYGRLADKYEYTGLRQRVPFPFLSELLVKAIFPGNGPADWTGFISSRMEAVAHMNDASISGRLPPVSTATFRGVVSFRCSRRRRGAEAARSLSSDLLPE